MMDNWKPIKGYEGLYEVSDTGKVRSVSRMVPDPFRPGHKRKFVGRELRVKSYTGDYRYVTLSKDNRVKCCRLHRLVAAAFIPNPNNLPQVNHKDEDKGNNSATNLEWCTSEYNHKYGTRMERIIERRKRPVLLIDDSGNVIKQFPGSIDAGRELGISPLAVARVARGERSSCYGYKFRRL